MNFHGDISVWDYIASHICLEKYNFFLRRGMSWYDLQTRSATVALLIIMCGQYMFGTNKQLLKRLPRVCWSVHDSIWADYNCSLASFGQSGFLVGLWLNCVLSIQRPWLTCCCMVWLHFSVKIHCKLTWSLFVWWFVNLVRVCCIWPFLVKKHWTQLTS